MKASRLLCCTCLGAATAILALAPQSAMARATVASVLGPKLGGNTILNASQAQLITAVQESVKQNPLMAGAIVKTVLSGGRADADALSPKIVEAAIQGLGDKPSSAQISDIVYNSVKETPTVVLNIVQAAVKATPDNAKVIVKAAMLAIANPDYKITAVEEHAPMDGQQHDGFTKDDYKDGPPPDAANNQLLPIGEAIAQAALQADPSLSMTDLMAATNHTGGNFSESYPGYYFPVILSGIPSGSSTPSVMPTPSVVSK